jgi:CRP-like cAMP-binding protein
MMPQTPQADHFIARLRASLQDDMRQAATRTMAKHAHVYTCGEHDAMVYVIVSGHIKLLVLSPEGKQCLLAIYTAGDIFGELCLAAGGGKPPPRWKTRWSNKSRAPSSCSGSAVMRSWRASCATWPGALPTNSG